MMKKVFDAICVSFLLINNNVYTFISGILLSLSTGIFTTLCFEKTAIAHSWHLYASSVLYAISGALLIYVASQIATYQNYIVSKHIIDKKAQRAIIDDFEAKRYGFWILFFLTLMFTLVSGSVLLLLNYIM